MLSIVGKVDSDNVGLIPACARQPAEIYVRECRAALLLSHFVNKHGRVSRWECLKLKNAIVSPSLGYLLWLVAAKVRQSAPVFAGERAFHSAYNRERCLQSGVGHSPWPGE